MRSFDMELWSVKPGVLPQSSQGLRPSTWSILFMSNSIPSRPIKMWSRLVAPLRE